jgi:hypothetical protein
METRTRGRRDFANSVSNRRWAHLLRQNYPTFPALLSHFSRTCYSNTLNSVFVRAGVTQLTDG